MIIEKLCDAFAYDTMKHSITSTEKTLRTLKKGAVPRPCWSIEYLESLGAGNLTRESHANLISGYCYNHSLLYAKFVGRHVAVCRNGVDWEQCHLTKEQKKAQMKGLVPFLKK